MVIAYRPDRGAASARPFPGLLEVALKRLMNGLVLVGTSYACPAAAHATRTARRAADRAGRLGCTRAEKEVEYLEALWQMRP